MIFTRKPARRLRRCILSIKRQANWKVHHDVLKSNGKKAVSLDLEGGLLNLATRKSALPTLELLETFHLIPRTADFEVLSEMRR